MMKDGILSTCTPKTFLIEIRGSVCGEIDLIEGVCT